MKRLESLARGPDASAEALMTYAHVAGEGAFGLLIERTESTQEVQKLVAYMALARLSSPAGDEAVLRWVCARLSRGDEDLHDALQCLG